MQRVGFLSASIISNPQTELKPVLFSIYLYICRYLIRMIGDGRGTSADKCIRIICQEA